MAVAAALGSLVVAAPAHAAGNVGVTVGQLADFSPGQTQKLSITVTYKGDPTGTVTVSLSGLGNFTPSDPQGCMAISSSSCT
ncbi:MAG: hypothetical protein JWP76_1918, partial [Dactylosporangium sp.]|nr:hypothetical protein [Dactylosporangium sp.]